MNAPPVPSMAWRKTAIVVSVGLCILVSSGRAAASVVTVPGDFPTLQAVADWQVQQKVILDTVLVLPEVPFEPATFMHHGPLVLAGQPGPGGELPRVGRLELLETADMRVQSLHIDGPVRYAWADYVFRNCVIESTVVWLGASDPGSIAVRSCTLNGNPAIDAMQDVVVDSCQVNGTIKVSAHADATLWCYQSVFTGPGDWAIRASVSAPCEMAGNTIRGFANGIFAQNDGSQFAVRGNLIEDCSGTAIKTYPAGGRVEVDRNVIRRCGSGIDVMGAALVRDNLVLDCAGDGLHVVTDEWVEVARNVAARCGGDGFFLALETYGDVTSRNNTSSGNGGNGFVLYGSIPFTHNIAHANQGYGVTADSLRPPLSGCNDWYANQAGDVRDFAPAASDLAVDPRFCAAAEDDFQLMTDSPLADAEGCGLIGALGVGCGSTGAPDAATASSPGLRASPNPSRGPVLIEFSLGRQGWVALDVFDLQGRRVASLARGVLPAGTHAVQWSGLAPRGASPSGVYVARLRHPDGDRFLRLIRTR